MTPLLRTPIRSLSDMETVKRNAQKNTKGSDELSERLEPMSSIIQIAVVSAGLLVYYYLDIKSDREGEGKYWVLIVTGIVSLVIAAARRSRSRKP
jgi:hypothetical protein